MPHKPVEPLAALPTAWLRQRRRRRQSAGGGGWQAADRSTCKKDRLRGAQRALERAQGAQGGLRREPRSGGGDNTSVRGHRPFTSKVWVVLMLGIQSGTALRLVMKP